MRGRTVRKVVIALALALGALAAGASSASAVGCVTTDFTQDSHLLTAALVNPPDVLVPAHVDGSGCDIGIYYSDSLPGGAGTHTLSNKSVFGSTYYGVLSRGASVVTNITNVSSVYDVGDQPSFTGTQHGVSISYREGADGTVDHSQIYDYQKGGVVATGTGTNVRVLSDVVRGQGPTPLVAQNGVQFSSRATGNVNNNLIEDHFYTGCSKQDSKATGCIPYVSTGILLFDVDPTLVDTKNNTFRNNQVNLYNGANSSP